MEVLYQRLNIDPIDGLTILDACDLENLPSEMPSALVITQVYNQQRSFRYKIDFDGKLSRRLSCNIHSQFEFAR